MRWDLKEVVRKLPALVTRTLAPYRVLIRPRCPDEVPSQTEVRRLPRDIVGRWDEYMGEKHAPLSGEVCFYLKAGVSRGHSSVAKAREGPNFGTPDEELLRILQYIENKGGVVRNKDVIEYLESEDFLEVGDVRNKSQSLNKKFRERYRDRLTEKWGFVTLEGKTRNRKIRLTKEGERYLKMFEYLV